MNQKQLKKQSQEQEIEKIFQKFQTSSVNLSFTTSIFKSLNKSTKVTQTRCNKSQKNRNYSYKKKYVTQEDEKVTNFDDQNILKKKEKFKLSNPVGKKMFTMLQCSKPYQTIKEQKLIVNPAITKQNFFVKIFSPTMAQKPSQLPNSQRKLTLISRNSYEQKLSHRSNRSRQSSQMSKQSIRLKKSPRSLQFARQLKIIEQYINDDRIISRLINFLQAHNSPLPTQKAKYNVRVYKEDYKKIFQDRYGKDRVTNYINLEFITQFSQIKETLSDIIKYSKEQILLLVFIIIDQNRDGLITAQDLIALNGTSRNQIKTNLLIQEDISRIIQYVKEQKSKGDIIFDNVTNGQIIKEEQLTIIKYRMYNFQQKKKNKKKERTKSLITRNLHDHLFTLKQTPKSSEPMRNLFNIKNLLDFSKMMNEREKLENFSINFQRFCIIFDQIPKIFYDVLFVLAGIQKPEFFYSPIDWKILDAEHYKTKNLQTSDESNNLYAESMRRLEKLKEFKKKMKIVKW